MVKIIGSKEPSNGIYSDFGIEETEADAKAAIADSLAQFDDFISEVTSKPLVESVKSFFDDDEPEVIATSITTPEVVFEADAVSDEFPANEEIDKMFEQVGHVEVKNVSVVESDLPADKEVDEAAPLVAVEVTPPAATEVAVVGKWVDANAPSWQAPVVKQETAIPRSTMEDVDKLLDGPLTPTASTKISTSLGEIDNAKDAILSCVLEIARWKAKESAAKAKVKSLQAILDELSAGYCSMVDDDSEAVVEKLLPPDQIEAVAADVAAEAAWRSIESRVAMNIAVLPGFGKKTSEALYEKLPTMGHMCDAMAKGFHHYSVRGVRLETLENHILDVMQIVHQGSLNES